MKRLLLLLAIPVFAQAPQLTDGAGHDLRLLPAGQFIMGYNRYRADFAETFGKDHVPHDTNGESPCHPVHITKPFYLASREVTVGQFRSFVKASSYVTSAEKSGDGIVGWHNVIDYKDKRQKRRFRRVPEYTWKTPGFEQSDAHPVVGISWADADAYCRWLSAKEGATYRLPTEAEWEYAAGAGSPGFFGFGDDYHTQMHTHANFGDCSMEEAHEDTARRLMHLGPNADGHVFTAPAGSLRPNDWGLYDMHGNVWELCQDYYLDTYYNRYKPKDNREPPHWVEDPVNLDSPWNPDSGDWRIIKGGSFVNNPAQCHSSYRSWFEKTDGACYVGFRVARDASGPKVDAARDHFARIATAMNAVDAHKDARWEVAFHQDKSGRLMMNPAAPELAEHLPNLTRVAILEIHRGFPPEYIPAIAQMSGLRALRIYQPGRDVPREAYAPLAALAKLEELVINNYSNIHPEDVANWACVANLRLLNLGNDQLDASTLAGFRDKKLSKLEELRIESLNSDGSELAYFRGSPLVKLALSRLTDEGAELVATFSDLVELRVNEPKISAAGLAHLASLKKLKSLRLSNLKGLADADFAPLARMVSLEEVSLAGSGAGDVTAANLAKLPRLRRLNIGSPAFTDEGLRHIGGIATLNHLLEIGEHAAITDAGLEHIWAPDHVTMLFLRPRAGITGAGLGSIAENLTRLAHIEIHSVDFGDEGMRLLGYMPELKVVKLHGGASKVTDAGLIALAEAPILKELEIRGDAHAITAAGIAAAKEKRPNLKVIR